MKRSSRTAVRLALVVLLCSAGGRVRADDFEIAVPVSVSKLDATFTQGKVSCKVYGQTRLDALGASRLEAAGSYGLIGSGEATFPISKGAHEGTVAVKFWANRQGEAANARDYACALTLVEGNSVRQLCAIVVDSKQVRAVETVLPPKVRAAHPCTSGKVPLPPRP